MRKDAALKVFGKRPAHIGLGCEVVALPIKLPRTGKLQPSLGVFGYRLVQQRALGVARVVEFEFGG